MIRIALFGAGGRMGRAVLAALGQEEDIEVAWAVESPDIAGRVIEGLVSVSDDSSVIEDVDVWVDVSLADAALEHALRAEKLGLPILVGATGFSAEQNERLAALSCAHIVAPNLSVGVNLLFNIAPRMRSILGEGFDVAIVETHHKHKKDAPSGTARRLAEGLETEGGPVQVVSLRIGEVVGEHSVRFATEGEEIEIVHRAHSRAAFARGVAPAVRFLAGKTAGTYTMSDALGLERGTDRT